MHIQTCGMWKHVYRFADNNNVNGNDSADWKSFPVYTYSAAPWLQWNCHGSWLSVCAECKNLIKFIYNKLFVCVCLRRGQIHILPFGVITDHRSIYRPKVDRIPYATWLLVGRKSINIFLSEYDLAQHYFCAHKIHSRIVIMHMLKSISVSAIFRRSAYNVHTT